MSIVIRLHAPYEFILDWRYLSDLFFGEELYCNTVTSAKLTKNDKQWRASSWNNRPFPFWSLFVTPVDWQSFWSFSKLLVSKYFRFIFCSVEKYPHYILWAEICKLSHDRQVSIWFFRDLLSPPSFNSASGMMIVF